MEYVNIAFTCRICGARIKSQVIIGCNSVRCRECGARHEMDWGEDDNLGSILEDDEENDTGEDQIPEDSNPDPDLDPLTSE